MLHPVAGSKGCEVTVSYRADGVVAGLVGSMDLSSAPQVERELRALVMSPVSVLTLDLSRLAGIDDAGQRVLVELERLAVGLGTSIVIVGAPSEVVNLTASDQDQQRTRFR